MRDTISLYLCIFACIGAALFQCSHDVNPTLSGGASEETNARVYGVVTDPEGLPVTNTPVTLRSVLLTREGDSAAVLHIDKTDPSGEYVFESVPLGKYVISCSGTGGNIGDVQPRLFVDGKDRNYKKNLSMAATCVLSGRVLTHTAANAATVFIPGLDVSTLADDSGRYVLPDVPPGRYDIVFQLDSIINYLLVDISDEPLDTVYLKDVSFAVDSGRVVSPYSYYDTEGISSYSVVPREYKAANEPAWYAGKDFSAATYFSGADTTQTAYIPQIQQVLFVSRFWPEPIEDDAHAISRMEGMGVTVFARDQDDLLPEDTIGMDLVWLSYHVLSTTLSPWIYTIDKPIIACETNLFDKMHMANTFGNSTGSREIEIVDSLHPLSAGLSGLVTVSDVDVSMTWGTPGPAASVIAVLPGSTDQSTIFAYEKGALLVDGSLAPAKRIGWYTNVNGFNSASTEEWMLLFEAVIDWGQLD